jgi:restriction endonuclease
MDLIAWLEDLAATYRIEPSEMTTRRYLKSLERWHLSMELWEQLSDRAVLRYARFQSIAELYDIACELRHQAEIKVNSEWISKMREEWNHHQGEEKGDGSACSGLQALK